MAPAAIMNNSSEQTSHSLTGRSSVKAGEQQQTAHIFPECDGAAMVVEPSVDGSTEAERDPLEGFDYRQFFEAGEDAVEAKISDTMNMPSETTQDEDFWFPADLFTDELNFNKTINAAAEVVSQSSRADNSTTYNDELEIELFNEVPQTIDVPKRKKARTSGEENEQFSSHAHSSTPLLSSWQPKARETGQFSVQPCPLRAPFCPPPVVSPYATATSTPLYINTNTSVKATKPNQIKDLLAILCENISSDPNQSVEDLMTLRVLLIRPRLTPDEDHLLNTVLILFESYLLAGRSRPDIATMVVRDFSFHFKHQQQTYAAQVAPTVSPMLSGQDFGEYSSPLFS